AAGPAQRAPADRRGDGAAAVTADLLTSGDSVLVVCADVARRRESLERLLGGMGRLALTSWDAFAAEPGLAAAHPHLVAMDPPPIRAGLALLECAPADGPAFAHLAWGAPEIEFALAVARACFGLRPAVADFYRRLRDAG